MEVKGKPWVHISSEFIEEARRMERSRKTRRGNCRRLMGLKEKHKGNYPGSAWSLVPGCWLVQTKSECGRLQRRDHVREWGHMENWYPSLVPQARQSLRCCQYNLPYSNVFPLFKPFPIVLPSSRAHPAIASSSTGFGDYNGGYDATTTTAATMTALCAATTRAGQI